MRRRLIDERAKSRVCLSVCVCRFDVVVVTAVGDRDFFLLFGSHFPSAPLGRRSARWEGEDKTPFRLFQPRCTGQAADAYPGQSERSRVGYTG